MDKKEFYDSLSSEVKEKIRSCTSEEEALRILEETKVEIPPELLAMVSGGCKHEGGDGEGDDGENNEDDDKLKYWIIDGGGKKDGGC